MPGARDVAVEFFTFSKTFCMTGWRLGAVVGCTDVIHAFSVIHTNINAGVFAPIQLAGIEALDLAAGTGYLDEMCRRDFIIDAMNRMGWNLAKARGAAYVQTVSAGRPYSATAQKLKTTDRNE